MSRRSIGILIMLTATAAGAADEEIRLAQRAPANTQRQPVETTQQTRSTTIVSPSEGEPVTLPFRVTVQAPPDVEARRYNLECAYWDDARATWVYPGLIGDGFAGGQTAATEITAAMLKRLSATATRWRLRARLTDPSRSWGDWREFTLRSMQSEAQAAAPSPAESGIGQARLVPAPVESRSASETTRTAPGSGSEAQRVTAPSSLTKRGPVGTGQDTAAVRPPSTAPGMEPRIPTARDDQLPGIVAEGTPAPSTSQVKSIPIPPSSNGGTAQAGSGLPLIAKPLLHVWAWNVLEQTGVWTQALSLEEPEKVKLRWRPAVSAGEAGYVEIRGASQNGSFDSAKLVDQWKVEMPKAGEEWAPFELDLGKYAGESSARVYVTVHQVGPVSAPVEIKVGLPKKLNPYGQVQVAGVQAPTRVLTGPDAKAPKFATGNHMTVVFKYSTLKPVGGRIAPALVDDSGKISGRNYWEFTDVLQGTSGEVSSRMTITCPTPSAPEVRIGSVYYTVTDASDNEVFKGVAPLPQEMVFRCPSTPARSDRNEILFSEAPDKTAGTLPITMTFHKKPDCECDYGRVNINYQIYIAVKTGGKARLFSYLLREDGKPVMENWIDVKMIPEYTSYGYVLTGGKIMPTLTYYDPVYCRPASSPGWGPNYRIKGIRVELRNHDPWKSIYGLNPWELELLATDTYPVDIEVVCK